MASPKVTDVASMPGLRRSGQAGARRMTMARIRRNRNLPGRISVFRRNQCGFRTHQLKEIPE